MQTLFKILLSPLGFAIGFLWPLVTQSLIALNFVEPGWQAMAIGAVCAFAFGMLAQIRGSWIWIR